jgi:hypothetical protein
MLADVVKVLTVRQPWASLIMAGAKDVENRTWSTRHRGQLAIHAAGTLETDALAQHRNLLNAPADLPRGTILGTVTLTDIVTGHASPWAEPGHYHWLLADPRPFDEPRPMPGRLGLWTWEP